jgi:hypothetical protein
MPSDDTIMDESCGGFLADPGRYKWRACPSVLTQQPRTKDSWSATTQASKSPRNSKAVTIVAYDNASDREDFRASPVSLKGWGKSLSCETSADPPNMAGAFWSCVASRASGRGWCTCNGDEFLELRRWMQQAAIAKAGLSDIPLERCPDEQGTAPTECTSMTRRA